jgi:hypothetical protein
MIHDVRVSDDGDEIAVICGEQGLGFDAALETERWRAGTADVDHACLHLSGKSRDLVGWRKDRLIKVALDIGKELASANLDLDGTYPKSAAVSPDGAHICAIYGDDFFLLDSSLRPTGRRRIQYANSATFSPDSQLLALSSWGKGEIWRVAAFPDDSTAAATKKGKKRA